MGHKNSRCEHNDALFDDIAESKIEPFVAIVGGATGVVGKRLVKRLVEHHNCAEVVVLTRRRVRLKKYFQVNDLDAHKISQYVLDFTKPLDLAKHGISRPDIAFCCFSHDSQLAYGFARACYDYGVMRFGYLGCKGSDSKSVFYECKLQGLQEDAIRRVPFTSMIIYRPGLLDRQECASIWEKCYPFPKINLDHLAAYMMWTLLLQKDHSVMTHQHMLECCLEDERIAYL